MACMIVGTAALPFSTCVIRRARARRSPATMRSTSAAGSALREIASGPAIGERPNFSTLAHPGARRTAALRGSQSMKLLPHENEIGQHLNVVRDLEEEQLRHLHAVRGKGRAELRLHLDIVAREPEPLLLVDLLWRELDVHHRGLGHDIG